jgi:heat-inducible transcriptional repressor
LKPLKQLPARSNKENRARRILIALIEHYLLTGKPVGSSALREAYFTNLSSATIRNYFANLEQEGYLSQQHTSGGRLPTEHAYRLYAQDLLPTPPDAEQLAMSEPLRQPEMREITAYLQRAAELFSDLTNNAVFISAPRFDNDFIAAIRLIAIDATRYLALLVTDFGMVKTELLHVDQKLTTLALKGIEEYCQWRLTGFSEPEHLSPEELTLAQKIYNELMVRYVVSYSAFTADEIYRTGFSKLLIYPEFQDPLTMTASLTLFENSHTLKLLTKTCRAHDELRFWIGSDLASYTATTPPCCVAAIPYRINTHAVGVLGALGPMRMPYRQLFMLLRAFSGAISEALTRNIYKFKIKYRTPEENPLLLQGKKLQPIDRSHLLLLEKRDPSGL